VKFIVNGGKELNGEVKISGAKNAANKMMIATLLTNKPCVLENCPDIGETEIVAEICEKVGSKITRNGETLTIETPEITSTEILSLSRHNRLSILAMGALLARVGEAKVPVVGGDKIGPRPVDMHIGALESMGATIKEGKDYYSAFAKNGLFGANITLPYPSVMTTENIIIAGTLAKGKTVIHGAATEPEILDLIKMLQKMGAVIELGANRKVYIDGVDKLNGANHSVIPDRNEAVSFGVLAVAVGGDILAKGARQEDLITFLNSLRRVDGDYKIEENGIRFFRKNGFKNINIETDTHPGFMTDWQQPFMVLLTQAKGISIIHETVYEDRFEYIKDLNKMGANISLSTTCSGDLPCRFSGKSYEHSATVNGSTPLHGVEITVRDLRAGIAKVVAALIADGRSVINGVEEIDRGYENLDERLRELGADIERVI